VSVHDVLELFAKRTDSRGFISRESFEDCFEELASMRGASSLADADAAKLRAVLDGLYDQFDKNGDGLVDFTELTSGLTILCGDNRDQKAKAAFALYDFNGDGVISLEEMTKYLASVFNVMYHAEPGTANEIGADPMELAEATARDAFEQADLDSDGRLSFEEFKKWYKRAAELEDSIAQDKPARLSTLAKIRTMTNLDTLKPQDVTALFRKATAADGTIDRDSFENCFEEIVRGRATPLADSGTEELSDLVDGLYTLFDADGDGVVDSNELMSGLSVLCGGDRDEKAAAAFALYDYNGDGVISLEEFTRYLTSVFKVMYHAEPGVQEKMGGFDPKTLAAATAT